mmetsp:Transcript_133411/g.285286  ORF Transcript_133411/g.285286 Transcript_133411/m.285286 type:complete len:362 (+) Transcript_133411:67-1152(+)
MAGDGPSIMEVRVQDVVPQSPCGIIGCGCGSIVTFILIILFFPATVTQLGQFKLGLTKNKISGVVDMETAYTPGRYWIGFWKEFIEFPSTLQTIEFSNEKPEEGVQHLSVLRSRDKDGKQIYMDISVQYKLYPEKIGKIYREMTTTYEDVYISELRDAFSKAGNQFAISKAWEDYAFVVQLLKESCDRVLSIRHAECWGVQLWGVRLEGRYEQALVRTQVQKQSQRTEEQRKVVAEVRAKTQVMLSEYRKNVTIIEAGGLAQKYQIERLAQANAQGAIIKAQAQAIDIVRDIVKPNASATGPNAGLVMNESQLISYQKFIMLQDQTNANMVFGTDTEAMNVHALKLMNDRRLDSLITPQEL